MRSLYLTGLAAIVLLVATSVSFAGVIHEDFAYWYTDSGQTQTIFNPSTDWLNQNVGKLLIKVQQTVYDEASTTALLQENGDGTRSGFLYAYSVTNLYVGTPGDTSDKGITRFNVNWTPAPLYVTTDKQQTLPNWVVDTSVTQPAWKWTSAISPGIKPGRTVGGFWAVSNVGVDGVVNAGALHVGPNGEETFNGKTTGPMVPDAPTFLSLATGLMGLGLTRRLRRK